MSRPAFSRPAFSRPAFSGPAFSGPAFSGPGLRAAVLACAALPFAAPIALAEGVSCHNEELPEVLCGDDGCSADQGTPIRVSVDAAGAVSACIYSGCYEGPATLQGAAGPLRSFVFRDALFSTNTDMAADLILSMNLETGLGTLLVHGFATPMRCAAE